MDNGKENDTILLQQGLPSASSRIQGMKNVLGGNRKAAESSTQRKPLGSVQNICASSANEDKTKLQKKSEFIMKDVNYKKQAMSSGLLPNVDLQPYSAGQENVDSASSSAGPPSPEYDEIEHMHREIHADDDFSDLYAVANHPTSFINDLLNWYPRGQITSPVSECSVSPVTPPDWKRMMHIRYEEQLEEPVIPEFRLLNDFDFDF